MTKLNTELIPPMAHYLAITVKYYPATAHLAPRFKITLPRFNVSCMVDRTYSGGPVIAQARQLIFAQTGLWPVAMAETAQGSHGAETLLYNWHDIDGNNNCDIMQKAISEYDPDCPVPATPATPAMV